MIRRSIENMAYSPDNGQHQSQDFLDSIGVVPVDIPSEAGNVRTWRLEPETPLATLVHFHGSGFNLSKHIDHVCWLKEHGFRVIAFDYPGYGDSTGEPSRQSVMQAADVVLNWVARSYPSQKMFLFGQSLGGAIAIEAIIKFKPDYLGLILDSTFSRYRDMAVHRLVKFGLPGALARWFAPLLNTAHDPIEFAKALVAPTLVLHSTTDDVVPFSQGKMLFRNIPGAEFWPQHARGHTDVLRPDFSDFRQRLVGWMLAHLNE